MYEETKDSFERMPAKAFVMILSYSRPQLRGRGDYFKTEPNLGLRRLRLKQITIIQPISGTSKEN